MSNFVVVISPCPPAPAPKWPPPLEMRLWPPLLLFVVPPALIVSCPGERGDSSLVSLLARTSSRRRRRAITRVSEGRRPPGSPPPLVAVSSPPTLGTRSPPSLPFRRCGARRATELLVLYVEGGTTPLASWPARAASESCRRRWGSAVSVGGGTGSAASAGVGGGRSGSVVGRGALMLPPAPVSIDFACAAACRWVAGRAAGSVMAGVPG